MAECSLPSSFSSASSAGPSPSLSSSSSIANQIDIPDEPHHPKTIIHTEVLVQVNLFGVVSNPVGLTDFHGSPTKLRMRLFLL